MSEPPENRLAAAPGRWVEASLIACFFFGGLTSLALETAWSKSLSYLLGTDLYGAATTIVAYMAGLGLGAVLAVRRSARLPAPLLTYALLQLGIGALGMVSVPFLVATEPLFELLHGLGTGQVSFLLLRFLVTFALLLPATTLMGMTLPVVVGAHAGIRLSTPRAVGLIYGMNTLGAVAGTVLAGFLLVPKLGLTRSCVTAGALDLAIALAVFGLHRAIGGRVRPEGASQPEAVSNEAPAEPAVPPRDGTTDAGVPAAVLLSGMMALALELCWFRLMGQIIGPTVQAFAITLSVFLVGVGLGSVVGSRVMGWFRSGEAALLCFLVLGAAGAALPAHFLDDVPALYQALWARRLQDHPEASLLIAQALTAAALMLPATLFTGAVFPAAVRAHRDRTGGGEPLAATSGKLYFLNTLGSAAGTLLWAFAFLPHFGAHGGIRLAAAVALVGALIVLVTPAASASLASWRSTRIVFGGLAALAAVLTVLIPRPDVRTMNAGAFSTIRSTQQRNPWLARPLHQKAEVVFVKDGVNGTVAVIKNRFGDGGLDLAFSGKWVASTNRSTRRSLVLLAHLPVLAALRPPRTGLVIGMGTGITTGSLLLHESFESVDLVEIEAAVLEAADLFAEYNHSPLKDPRTNVIIQDGRTYITFASKKYDIITSDPIHPWVKGAANLYTREYYASAAERLEPEGIFCQWIPSTTSVPAFHSILKSLHAAFPHTSFLFADREVVALASLVPIQLNQERVRAELSDPEVAKSLAQMRIGTPEALLSMVADNLHPIAKTRYQYATLNTDDNVYLEHLLPWDTFHGHVVQVRPPKKK